MSKTLKKDMSLLMVLMAVLSFVIMPVSAYAARVCTEAEKCPSCPKSQLWNIPVTCDALPQGMTGGNAVFDFDATYGYCQQALPGGGYLGYPGTRNRQIVNNKLVVDICCCPDACDFVVGDVIGVELEILTKGVYWTTDVDVPALGGLLGYNASNCYGGGLISPIGSVTAPTVGSYMHALTFSRHTKNTVCNLSTQPADSLTVETDNVDQLKVAYYTAQRQLTDQAGSGTAGISNGRAKILRTPSPYDGYELTQADVIGNLCDFWIDVPAMVAVQGEVDRGAVVQLRAKILVSRAYNNALVAGGVDPSCTDDGNTHANTLSNLSYLRPTGDPGIIGLAGTAFENDPPRCQATNGSFVGTGVGGTPAGCSWRWPSTFCPECQSPCSCTIDIGILCCESTVAPTACCIYFPYVLSGLQNENGIGWVTGIGLTRISNPAEGATPNVTLTLTDSAGVKYTANPPFGYVLGEVGMSIDGMISDLTWTPAIPADHAGGQWWLKVDANFGIDGYQFNLNNAGNGAMFGAGVLPRQGCTSICR